MLIKEVTLNGIKGCSGTHALKTKNLISGKNGAGKSAIFAAIQLALRGDVDGIGAANNKLGALAKGGTACTTVKVGDEIEATASITVKKGTSSVSRTVSHNGMPMDTKAISTTLFGKVPQTQSELNELTGEELCEILMPKGAGAEIPVQVSNYANAFREVSSALANPDMAVSIQSASDKTKDLISTYKAEVKRLTAIASEETPKYIGMPVHEAKEKLAHYNNLLANHKAAITNQTKVKVEIARVTDEIEYHEKEMKARISNAPSQQEQEEFLRQAAQDISTLESISKMPMLEISALSADRVNQAEAECLAIAEEGFIDPSPIHKFFAEANKHIQDNDLETQPRYIAVKPIVDSRRAGTYRSMAENPGYAIDQIKKHVETLKSSMENLALRNSQSATKIKALQEYLSSIQTKTFDVMDSDRLNDVIEGQKEAQACVDLAARIESSERTKAETNKKIGEVELTLETLESLLSEIQAWRRSVIDSTIEQYEQESSLFFKTKFEMSTGKRSAVTIMVETEDGFKPMSVVSGAERVLAAYQVIRAMQKIKKVKVPVIFVEGGELDPTSLKRLLDKCDDETTTLIAHYLNSEDAEDVNHIFAR